MRRFVMLGVMFLAFPGIASAEVKIYLDETRTEYVMAEKLDCKVYEGKKGLTIGFKASAFFFNIGPEFSLGGANAIKWDKTVHGIIARYKELCTRFNSGAITMKEYNERLEQIDGISQEAMELQSRLEQRVKAQSKDAFRELEGETGGTRLSEIPVGDALSEIGVKLEGLE